MVQQISEDKQAEYMKVMADYDELLRLQAEQIGRRKPVDHFTRCRDCGRFTDKSRWVLRESSLAKERGHRPICNACFDEYDWRY
jgi:hypothetical protein